MNRLILALSGLLLVSPTIAGALTLAELRTNARLLVSDSGTATARLRFSNSQIDSLLNECQSESVSAAFPIMDSTHFELTVGATYYSLPNSFLAVKRVTWKNRVLTEKSPVSLDNTKEWETVSGSPLNYFVTFSSRTKLGIYPYPADSSSTGTIKVEYYAQATDLSADSDIPYNGIREFYPVHHTLTYCAASRMGAIDGQNQLAAFYMQLYAQAVARLSAISNNRPAYTPAITPNNAGGQ